MWCKRLGKFGTVLEKNQFMCLVSFNSVGELWLHPVELEHKPEDVIRIVDVRA